MKKEEIVLSIVTIVLNDEKGIQVTMDSVERIISDSIEHIIVDGCSTDGTLKLIKSKNYNLKLISEIDKGIYDAMNKGVNKANGKYIQFLNSGDCLNKNIDLKYLLNILNNNSNRIYYGDTLLKWEHKVLIKKYNNKLNFDFGLPFNHQSCFTPKTLLKKYPFNSNFKILGDLEFYEKMFLKGYPFSYLNTVIADYDMSGISSRYTIKYLKELKAVKNYSFEIKWIWYTIKYAIKWLIRR